MRSVPGFGRCCIFLAPLLAADPVFYVPARSGGPRRDIEHRIRGQKSEREEAEHRPDPSRERLVSNEFEVDRASGRPWTILVVDILQGKLYPPPRMHTPKVYRVAAVFSSVLRSSRESYRVHLLTTSSGARPSLESAGRWTGTLNLRRAPKAQRSMLVVVQVLRGISHALLKHLTDANLRPTVVVLSRGQRSLPKVAEHFAGARGLVLLTIVCIAPLVRGNPLAAEAPALPPTHRM